MEQHALGILDARKSGSRTGGPSFSLQHRMLRAAWAVAWMLLAGWTPAPLHRWRAMLLRMFGAQLAANARVHGSARIWYPPNLVMEENALIGPRVICYAMAPIRICRNAVISQGAHLCAGKSCSGRSLFPAGGTSDHDRGQCLGGGRGLCRPRRKFGRGLRPRCAWRRLQQHPGLDDLCRQPGAFSAQARVVYQPWASVAPAQAAATTA